MLKHSSYSWTSSYALLQWVSDSRWKNKAKWSETFLPRYMGFLLIHTYIQYPTTPHLPEMVIGCVCLCNQIMFPFSFSFCYNLFIYLLFFLFYFFYFLLSMSTFMTFAILRIKVQANNGVGPYICTSLYISYRPHSITTFLRMYKK